MAWFLKTKVKVKQTLPNKELRPLKRLAKTRNKNHTKQNKTNKKVQMVGLLQLKLMSFRS